MEPKRVCLAAAIAASLTVLTSGCGGKLHTLVRPDQPPVATLTVSRLQDPAPDSAAFLLSWTGSDPDGRVDHFVYAVDPASVEATDATWQATTATSHSLRFGAVRSGARTGRAAAEPVRHFFAVRAVDNRGRMSAPVMGVLSLGNIPPTVQILSPQPSALVFQLTPPSVHITWTGNDPDGVFTQRPVKYKFKLFKDTDTEFPFDLARQNPDSLRRFYAPAFAGWDSVPGETTFVQYLNLVPNSRYLFALVGFDEAGDSNPVFSLTTNMLQFQVTFLGSTGPILTMYDEYFNYRYASGGYFTDPSRIVHVQVPNIPVTFNWAAEPQPGALMHSYRWVLDLADLSDETPRTDEATDWYHWSQKSLATSATVGPFQLPGPHRANHVLYIEAMDSNGNVSLGIVGFMVLPSIFSDEYSLLVVNDTRLLPDNAVVSKPDSLQPPPGPWPSAAELDTFLFARGGVRWRMTPNGTLSPPGIFAGYHYDTVATQFLTGGLVPLSMLTLYRHVIWITDQSGAGGALRAMSDRGRANLLAAYLKGGGQLWLLGGAAGYAATIAWNQVLNDQQPPLGVVKFSSTPVPGREPELAPSRFMYDFTHWQAGFWNIFGPYPIVRSAHAVGGWPGAPAYALLPTQIGSKTMANDPIPPFRSAATFYGSASNRSLETISEPTNILEDFAPTLDTLFEANGLPPGAQTGVNACMTYYHGRDNGAVVFSGFDLWSFTRPDLIRLADFVLQQIWALPRDPVSRSPAGPPLAGRRGQQ